MGTPFRIDEIFHTTRPTCGFLLGVCLFRYTNPQRNRAEVLYTFTLVLN